ncbi:MAG: hypothetical protein DWB99_08050 [Candidatus Poseidoniales archaeon]|nr:MAG: hypothetical protein DWB99_08050 [Candidatus Poseidoniales archaeon]|tara:strand:- start:518 stop:1183 length:666 start_codon:yes stop_codon:yes gene_type:complete
MVRARDKSPEAFGWTRVELKPNPKAVLYPLSWGILPIVFAFIMMVTKTGEEWIAWAGGIGIILFLVGGVSAVGPRQGAFNSIRIASGFFFCILALFSWVLVATNNLLEVYAILSSILALIMIYRSLDFIFKDIGLIYQIEWSAKWPLPTGSMVDWDIRSTRFSQNTMALKRFDGDRFAQIYGSRTTEGLVLRLDIFGIHEGNRFDYRTLGIDLQDFLTEDE